MKDENPFKDKLYQHTLPVRDEVWHAIEKKLPEKEDRRLPVFWFVLFVSALIGGSLMFGYTKRGQSPQPSVPQDTSKAITLPDISSVEFNLPAAAELAVSETRVVKQTSSDGYATENETTSHGGLANTATSTSSVTASTLSSPSSITSNRLSNNTSTNNTASIQAINSYRTPANIKTTPNTINTHTTAALANTVANSASHLHATTASASSTAVAQSNVDEEASANFVTPVARRNTRVTALLPGLQDDAGTDEAWLADMLAIRPDPNCYKFSAKGGQYFFSMDFFSGPGWSPRTFSASSGSAALYQTARKTTESSLYAWSAGARFNMHLHNGFAIRLGILYDQAGDIFDYTDTLATRSTTRIDSFFSADGSFLYADTSRILIFGTLIKRINNTYRHLDVPILMSYEIPWGRSTLMINGGPVFNLTSTHKGQILDPMLIPRSITPGQPNLLSAYKTSLGLSIYLGAGIVFPLTNHFAGIIEPRYLYRIKPVTIKSYPLEERRHYAGVNIGLRYFFK